MHKLMKVHALSMPDGLEQIRCRDRPAHATKAKERRSQCIEHLCNEATYRGSNSAGSEGSRAMFRENWTTKALPLLEQVRAGDQGALMHACDEDDVLRNTLIELIDEDYIDGAGVLRARGTSEPMIVFGALQLKLKGRIALH